MKKLIALILCAVLTLSCATSLADITATTLQGTVTIDATKACRVMISKGAEKHHFDIQEGETVLPLVYGEGTYSITEYVHVSGKKYRKEKTISVRYNGDADAAFIQPSLVVNYDDKSLAVVKAAELCRDIKSDKEKAKVIYNWVASQFIYDYVHAYNVRANDEKRYFVDIDKVFETRQGICYDLSIMLAAMLRSQGVVAKVNIGDGHAWLSVRIDGKYALMDIAAKLQTGKGKDPGCSYKAAETF